MISTIISGGLGNQMFMYAMARAMALRNGTTAVFNLKYGFDRDYTYHRKLELQNFNVKLNVSRRLTFDYPNSRFLLNVSRRAGFNILAPRYKYVKESLPLHFEEDLICMKDKNLFLEGYWQSERYFSDFRDIIRDEFSIIMPIDIDVENELNRIRSIGKDTVFIGVRRYQECSSLPKGVLLDESYYNRAIEIMESKLSNPMFVVFTQDPQWAKAHLKSKSIIMYADSKEGTNSSVKDMYLMTHCRHAIISNSSFYWWGAWLSTEKDGIVIAPNNFLNRDSVCEKWLKI